MDIKEAIEQLSGVIARQPNRDWQLLVKVFNPGTVGGTPCVSVKRLDVGFDWDNGKVMIESDVPLTMLSAEDVAAIHKSAKSGQSWHAYQAHKKQADRIKALKAEIAALKLVNARPLVIGASSDVGSLSRVSEDQAAAVLSNTDSF